jgi:hypothetical protein
MALVAEILVELVRTDRAFSSASPVRSGLDKADFELTQQHLVIAEKTLDNKR